VADDSSSILLIHGLAMTPRSWDSFCGHYERPGFKVLTPPWPRLLGEVGDIRHALPHRSSRPSRPAFR
jgi:non-heme chloroperoxidase